MEAVPACRSDEHPLIRVRPGDEQPAPVRRPVDGVETPGSRERPLGPPAQAVDTEEEQLVATQERDPAATSVERGVNHAAHESDRDRLGPVRSEQDEFVARDEQQALAVRRPEEPAGVRVGRRAPAQCARVRVVDVDATASGCVGEDLGAARLPGGGDKGSGR